MLKQILKTGANVSSSSSHLDATRSEIPLAESLAAHKIEKELHGEYPRRIRRSLVGRDLMLLAILPSLSLGLVDAITAHYKIPFANWLIGIVSVFGLSFGIGSWISETRQAMRRKNLLQYGKAQPAVVTDLHAAKLGQYMEYAYQTPHGDILFRSLVVSTTAAQDVQVGGTFTVLVAPEDERKVMPYFLAGEYNVAVHGKKDNPTP